MADDEGGGGLTPEHEAVMALSVALDNLVPLLHARGGYQAAANATATVIADLLARLYAVHGASDENGGVPAAVYVNAIMGAVVRRLRQAVVVSD